MEIGRPGRIQAVSRTSGAGEEPRATCERSFAAHHAVRPVHATHRHALLRARARACLRCATRARARCHYAQFDLLTVIHDMRSKYPFGDSVFDLLHASYSLNFQARDDVLAIVRATPSASDAAISAASTPRDDAASKEEAAARNRVATEGEVARIFGEWQRIVRPGG